MKRLAISIFAAAAMLAGAACAAAQSPEREMMASLMRIELASQVERNAEKISEGFDDDVRSAVADAAEGYRARIYDGVKAALLKLNPDADEVEEEFAEFIDTVNASPKKYASLRSEIAKGALKGDISAAGKFLGNIQTWLEAVKRGDDAPSLDAWLERDTVKKTAQQAPKKKKRSNSLRDAEASGGEFVEANDDANSSLRSFGAVRRARREKALKEAEAGMAQVAEQRRIADEEANAKKTAAAQAEASAMQARAEKLAAVEQEALVQRQNSWSTRIKNIVGAGLTAAGSSFFGTVGQRVGEAAAREVFK
jgi:hypothetical protein